jgi:hypothetical protein
MSPLGVNEDAARRRTFQEPTGQTDCAGVEPISDLRLFGHEGRPWISQWPTGLSDGWLDEHKKSQQHDSDSCEKNHCALSLKRSPNFW